VRQRVRRLARLEKYFEQKKNMKAAELQKAMAESITRERRLVAALERKCEYFREAASALTGHIDTARAAAIGPVVEYFVEQTDSLRAELAAARMREREKREAVIMASLTHRIWESLVAKNRNRLRSSEEVRRERLLDDLAMRRFSSEGRER
jgi:flagellar biosynthesis chaperone FliJ